MTADALRWAEYQSLLGDYTEDEWYFGAYASPRSAQCVGQELAKKYSTAVVVRGCQVLLPVPSRDDGLYKKFREAWSSGEERRERERRIHDAYHSRFEFDPIDREVTEWTETKRREYEMSQEEYVRSHR